MRHVMMWGQGGQPCDSLDAATLGEAGFCITCFWVRWQEAAAGERALEFQIRVHLWVLINFPILKSVSDAGLRGCPGSQREL